ncbi:MAG: hypothetical protein ACK50J_31295, partial [Planctomyces sp.]
GGLIGWIAPADAIVLPDFLMIDDGSYSDTTKNQQTVMLSAENVVLGTTTVVSTSVSIGYVVWMLRGGSLLTAFVSSLPAWQAFDPLPILNSFDKKDDEKDNDTLLSIATGSENPSETTEDGTDRPADQP